MVFSFLCMSRAEITRISESSWRRVKVMCNLLCIGLADAVLLILAGVAVVPVKAGDQGQINHSR